MQRAQRFVYAPQGAAAASCAEVSCDHVFDPSLYPSLKVSGDESDSSEPPAAKAPASEVDEASAQIMLSALLGRVGVQEEQQRELRSELALLTGRISQQEEQHRSTLSELAQVKERLAEVEAKLEAATGCTPQKVSKGILGRLDTMCRRKQRPVDILIENT